MHELDVKIEAHKIKGMRINFKIMERCRGIYTLLVLSLQIYCSS